MEKQCLVSKREGHTRQLTMLNVFFFHIAPKILLGYHEYLPRFLFRRALSSASGAIMFSFLLYLPERSAP